MMPTVYYLYIATILFAIGIAIVLTRKHIIMLLMGIELMLNATNLNLVAFSRNDAALHGQVFTVFVMIVAAAEAAVGLAILWKVYQHYATSEPQKLNKLSE